MKKENKILKLGKIVTINILLLMVLLYVVELFLQKKYSKETNHILDFDKRNILLREYPPFYDYSLTPENEYMSNVENLQQKPYRIRTDENGFIIGPNKSAVNDSVDLIFFGGSTTECLYVDENLRFPFLVGELLVDEETGKNIHCLNAGVSGNNSMHSTLNLLAKGVKLKPKMVVLMHNINDLIMLLNTGSYWKGPESKVIVQNKKEKKSFRNRYDDENAIVYFLKSKIIKVYPKLTIKLCSFFKPKKVIETDEWKNFRQKFKDKGSEINLKYEEAFEKSIKTFISICRANDIEVVLMTQFNRINTNDEFIKTYFSKDNKGYDFYTLVKYYDRFNDKIRAIADKEKIFLIDLDKLVPSDKMYIYDAIHLNNKGSELVANLIAIEFEKKIISLKLNK